MLNNNIQSLKKIIQSSDAKTAGQAAKILRVIAEKNPDEILKQEKDNLYKYLDIYNKYSLFQIQKLKQELEKINKLPAINIIIILHILQSFNRPTEIKWPVKSKIIERVTNYSYAINYFKNIGETRVPTRTHNPDIVEYAEKTIITTGVYKGQKFSHDRAPYIKKIMACLSPSSPYREVVFMSPAQTAKTFTANTVTMYYIECVPSEILYATSDETMAIKWLEREIVPRAHNAGIIFKSEVESRQSRKTGNTSYSKTFPGGVIDIASALSPSQMASSTKRIVFGDEVDRWKIKTGEQGSVVNQLRARTQAWENQAKIFWFSTPTAENVSVIYRLFLQGDQELYWVPCPYCDTFQLMDFSYGRGHGLKWEHRSGKIYKKSIELVCENQTCGRGIKESSKPRMLRGGEWRASAVPEYDHIISFNINGLYSFQLSWFDMIVGYEESQKSELAKQDFDQLKMGRPHRGSGARPKAERLIENRGKYQAGEVPEGVLYLTAFVDVQRGSEKNPDNPPRLEMEVLGIGLGYRTWSIDYKIFYGDTSDPYGGAWEELHQWALKTEMIFIRKIDGFRFPVSLVFIDSGYNTDVSYHFSQRWENTFPSKGRASIKKQKGEKPDELTDSSFKRYRAAKMSEDIILYEISTVYYKNQIYNNLKIDRLPVDPQRPGFCDFPIDYSEKYFNMLTAEEKMADGSFESYGRRNEALDCRVGCLCAADVFLDSELYNLRAWAKANGTRPDQILKITHRTVIDEMIKQTAVKKSLTK